MIDRARAFAVAAHGAIGQTRKYTGEPYVNHCDEVAGIVASVPHVDEMVAAAWLHDVVEDTKIPIETIHAEFGETVADYIYWLTDVSKPEDGNRAARKALDRAHIAKAPHYVKTIKIADLISNTRSIVARDPDFARVYIPEKVALLGVLKEGSQQLWDQAMKIARESGYA